MQYFDNKLYFVLKDTVKSNRQWETELTEYIFNYFFLSSRKARNIGLFLNESIA